MKRVLLIISVVAVAAWIAAGFLDTGTFASELHRPAPVWVAPALLEETLAAPQPSVTIGEASSDGLPAAKPAVILVAVGDVML